MIKLDSKQLAFLVGFEKQADKTKYESCVDQVKDDGKSEDEAHAICKERLDKTSNDYNYIRDKIRGV